MSLDALYMPRPAQVAGERVEPLGPWEEATKPETPEERYERRRSQWRRYAEANREARKEYQREWKKRRKVACL